MIEARPTPLMAEERAWFAGRRFRRPAPGRASRHGSPFRGPPPAGPASADLFTGASHISMSPALPRGQPGGSYRTPSDGSGGPVGSPAWTWSPVRSHRLSVHGRSARPSGRAAHRPAMSSPTPGSGRTSPDGPTPAPLWQRRRTSPNPSWMTSTPSSTRSSARSLDPSTGPGSRELRPRSAARRSTSGSRRLSPLSVRRYASDGSPAATVVSC
jgi:hypothetical protein